MKPDNYIEVPHLGIKIPLYKVDVPLYEITQPITKINMSPSRLTVKKKDYYNDNRVCIEEFQSATCEWVDTETLFEGSLADCYAYIQLDKMGYFDGVELE